MSTEPTQIPHDEVREASMSGNISALVSMFEDDAVLMPPNDTTLYGKEEIQSWWEEYFTYFRVTSSVETEREVTLDGDQAFVRSSFSITIVPDDEVSSP